MAGLRYLSASSKASMVSPAISLHRAGRHYQVVVIPVPAPLDRGEETALPRRNVSHPGTATHHVDDDTRQLGAGQIGDALLHQAQTGAGGCGHDARPGSSRSVHHVDGGDFTLRLQECPSHLWQV